MAKSGYVYIRARKRNGTLYIGVTKDLVQRIHRHRTGEAGDFTAKYGVKRLVHFEVLDRIGTAIAREKTLKKWRRRWKLDLIERDNPGWRDLFPGITGFPPARE
jgi:putative endonuclease